MYKILANTEFMGKMVHYMPSCHSTNQIASELIKKGSVNSGDLVITDFQTAGKGQLGNSWESAEGENLTFSIVLLPTSFDAKDQFYLTMITTLGITDYITNFLNIDAKIKWPNDIFYSKSKLAGILISNSIQNGLITDSVVGIGLNVNQTDFKTANANSLQLVTGREYPLPDILENIVLGIETRYRSLLGKQIRKLTTDYLTRLYGINVPMMFKLPNSVDKFEGIIRGVNESGLLKIEIKGRLKKFGLKEIVFLN